MGENGVTGNLALTYAFPIQLLIIAIGVGTGVGINALLSRKLGEKDYDGIKKLSATAFFSEFAFMPYFSFSGCSAVAGLSPYRPEKMHGPPKWAQAI